MTQLDAQSASSLLDVSREFPDPEKPPPPPDALLRVEIEPEPAITDVDVADWIGRFPEPASKLTRGQVIEAIRFDRKYPGGAIGAGDRPGIFDRIRNPFRDERPLSFGQRLQELEIPGFREFEAGFGTAELGQAADLVQGVSVLARVAGAPGLAADLRRRAGSVRAASKLAFEAKDRGAAGEFGEIVGSIMPSVVSLGISGGAWAPVLVYYGLVGAGAGSQDLRSHLESQGVEPGAIEELAVATGYAAAEVVPEFLGLSVIGRVGRDMAGRIGEALLSRNLKQAGMLLAEAGLASTAEGAEEVLTELAENAIAGKGIPGLAHAFDPDRPMSENLWRSFRGGLIGGGILITPAVAFHRGLPPEVQAELEKMASPEAREAIQALMLHEPGTAQVARPPPTSPLPGLTTASADVQAFVAALEPTQRERAEVAASAALQSELLSREDRAKARELLDELDATRIEQRVGEILQRIRQETTPAQVAAFWKSMGWETRKSTTTEVEELEGELRSARRVAQTILPRVREQVREIARGKAALDKKTRNTVARLVRSLVPVSEQPRFLGIVANAKAGRVVGLMDEIDLSLARQDYHDAVRELQVAVRRIKDAKITRAERAALKPLIQTARDAAFVAGTKARKQTFAQEKKPGPRGKRFAAAATTIRQQLEAAEEAVSASLEAERLRKAGELEKIKADRAQVVSNVNAPATDPLAEDKRSSPATWFRAKIADLRNLTRMAEHTIESVLERLMWREMTRAHDRMLLQVARAMRRIEDAAKRAGFRSMADALAKMSSVAGKGNVETVEITIGAREEPGEIKAGVTGPPAPRKIPGKTVTVPMGIAAWFHAADQETTALLLAGAPLQHGRLTEGATVSEDELDAIRKALPQNIRDFIDETKAIAEEAFPEVAQVVFRLTGRDPSRVPGYFRRRRNTAFTETAGLPEGFRGLGKRYLENLGFLREREGGIKSPIVVEDFLTALIDHVANLARVQHLAEPTRRAAAVLLAPEVQAAITARHGAAVTKDLVAHLEAGSLANPVQGGALARAIGWINGSLAASKLGLSPTSMLRQLGGIPRLAPILGPDVLTAGVNGFATISLHELTESSGFFWDRYVGSIEGRFSPTEPGQFFGHDQSMVIAALDQAARNVQAGDVRGAFQALRRASLSTLQILNFFDSINARIAWAGYKAQVNAQHPDWTPQQKLAWIAEKASDAIRETQNSSSVLDLSTFALQARGGLWSAFLLFSSDRFKAANRVRRAIAESPAKGAQAAAAEAVNILWSTAVGGGWPLLVSLFVAMLFGDDDDREKAIERATALDRNLARLAQETLGILDPTGTAAGAVSIARFQDAMIFESAAQSTLTDTVRAMGQMTTGVAQLASDEQEKGAKNLLFGFTEAVLDVGAVAGLNPLDTMMRTILRQAERQWETRGDAEGF